MNPLSLRIIAGEILCILPHFFVDLSRVLYRTATVQQSVCHHVVVFHKGRKIQNLRQSVRCCRDLLLLPVRTVVSHHVLSYGTVFSVKFR